MDKKDNGGPAFTCETVEKAGLHATRRVVHGGMSLRDYFAGQVLPVLVKRNEGDKALWGKIAERENQEQIIASKAYHYADAMLVARERK